MAFDAAPSGYFSGINTAAVVGGATGVFIPYSDLESYNSTVAVSESGDIRELVYSIVEAYTDVYLGLSTSDRPANLTASRSSSVPSDGILRKIYTITANLEFGNLSVADE